MSTAHGHIDLFIRPADVLLFRDGRPFAEGDRAEGMFPPAPVAFYGALRAAALAQHGVRFHSRRLHVLPDASPDLDAAWGLDRATGLPKADLGDATLTYFALAHNGKKGLEPLFPRPADVLKLKEGSTAPGAPDWLRVIPTAFPGPVHPQTNTPVANLLWQHRDERARYEDKTVFVTQDALAKYLATGYPPTLFEHPAAEGYKGEEAELLRKPFVAEPRTSVQIRDDVQRAEDGMLYTVTFTRPNQDVGFAVRLKHTTILDAPRGWLRLGGEARAACYESCTIPAFPDEHRKTIRKKIEATRRCTLVLVTPAPFEQGWLPNDIDANGTGKLGGCAVRLVGAALGRFETLGGWDLVRNRPRLARRAVPAGSVYFFDEVDNNAVDALFDACFGKSILKNENDKKLGLGLAYLGTWDPNTSTRHV